MLLQILDAVVTTDVMMIFRDQLAKKFKLRGVSQTSLLRQSPSLVVNRMANC